MRRILRHSSVPIPGVRSARRTRRSWPWAGLALAASVAFLACAAAPGPPAPGHTVIVISLDGTRPADLRPEDVPTLWKLASEGARAEALVPVFPTKTFPVHVSLMTGVRPADHGIVNNQFIDPERGHFDRSDIPSFIEVEPIWSWLAGRGVVSASYFWVGSEGPWRSGRGPRHWVPFDSSVHELTKVDQILAWLDLDDPAERPRLVTSWFHGADRAGHRDGPGSPAVRADLRVQDRAVERLVEGLRARGLLERTTLIFLSDHGMVATERIADLGAALKEAEVEGRIRGAGGFASLYLADADRDAERALAVVAGLGLEGYRREAAPPELGVDHPRFGDVVVIAPEDVTILSAGSKAASLRGWHGHRAELPSMAGILIAHGPGIAPGTRLGRISALDVAPTVVTLLGETPPDWMQGRVLEELTSGAPAGAPFNGVEESK